MLIFGNKRQNRLTVFFSKTLLSMAVCPFFLLPFEQIAWSSTVNLSLNKHHFQRSLYQRSAEPFRTVDTI